MIEKLEWDSDFFGYPVGKIMLSDENGILPADVGNLHDFRLIYVFSDYELTTTGTPLHEVDVKTTLVKAINNADSLPIHPSISEYAGGHDKVLKLLALESGIYSRFKRDSKFINNEYSKLYAKWIEDSINKKIADKLIVFIENESIEGFVSLKFKDTCSEIGLIAVDGNSRGKGIALSLLKAAFNFTRIKGLPSIRIVTQLENTPAMKLYTKAGFEIESKKYIYHLWI